MTRAELKKMIGQIRERLYPASMETDPWLRKVKTINERADERYRKELTALYADRVISNDARWNRWLKASKRRIAAMEKTQDIYEQYKREVIIPMEVRRGYLRPEALDYAKRRAVRA